MQATTLRTLIKPNKLTVNTNHDYSVIFSEGKKRKTDVPDESIMRLSDAFREEIRQNLIMRQQNDDTNSEGAVAEINEDEVETMQMFKEEGYEEGLKLGIQERAREEERLATLINKLISLGRNEDISKVTTDPVFRDSLYVQHGLKKTM